jgi:uncharacterized protein (DUF169 family)
MSSLKDNAEKIERILRLRTFVLGLQLFEKAEDLEKIDKLRRPESDRTLCQVLTMARTYGWTIGMTLENFIHNSTCPAVLGLYDRPDFMRDGSYKGAIWFKDKKNAKKYEDSMPVIPSGKFNALAIGPVTSERLDPDMIIIYANPAQMILVINGLQWKDYERMTFYCIGESSCADAIAQCYLSKKPSLTIPSYGERRFGHVQDDELVMAMPSDALARAAEGLGYLAKRGVRYPIPLFGVQTDPNEGMPEIFKHYHSLE